MKRFLITSILIATVLVGGVLAYALLRHNPVSSQDFFASGKGYFEQQKYSEAAIQFMNAVQKDPRNRDARYYLALSYINQKDLNSAGQQLLSLLEYYPDDLDANLRLGNLYLTGGSRNIEFFRKASEIAQKILSKEPQNVDALILSGNASAGLQDYRSSVDMFEKAVSIDPQNTSALVSLGTTQALDKNFPEAEQAFLKARQANPKDKGALISLANYYRAVQEKEKAEAAFKEALAVFPTDRAVYIQVIEFYYQTGKFDDAEKVLRDVQSRMPKDPAPSLLLVDLYASRNRPSDAQMLLLDLKKSFPDNLDVAGKLAITVLQSNPTQARSEIDQILKADPKNPLGQILLGQLQFAAGQYDAAEATLGKDSKGLTAYPQPEFILGQIAVRKGQIDQAQDHFQKSLAANEAYLPARVALAEVLLDKGKRDDSKAEIRKVLSSQPGFVPARLVKAAIDIADKNYPEAEQGLATLLKEQPDNPLVHRQMAHYLDSRGRTADAEKSYLRALSLRPDSLEDLQELAQFYARSKQFDRAIARINSVPDDKKHAVHYELLGSVYSQAGKLQDSEAAYKKALEKDPSRVNSVAYLAAQYIRSGRLDDGLKELDELIKRNPANPAAWATKGMIFESQSKVEEAKHSYTEALKVDPGNEAAANNLAYILAEQGRDLSTALGLAQTAHKKQSDSPSTADTLGWVYYKLGNYLLAREQLQFAVGKDPDNAVFQYHLAMIYKETKQIPEAQSALRKAIGSPKEFKEKSLAQAALKEIATLK